MRYTLAVTSCARHDLLKFTLDSFIECMDQMPHETVIVEDSDVPKPGWITDPKYRQLGQLRWLSNGIRMGQVYSIDRLYSEINTDFVFHCEDDWNFHEQGFIKPSLEILGKHPEISMVALRSDWNHPLLKDTRFPFQIAEPYWKGPWGGTCWNPGMRRLADCQKFGSYGQHVGYSKGGLEHEKSWSRMYLDAGFRIAVLPKYCCHIGGGRSKAIEPLPALPRILIAVPACHKFEYGRFESSESPHYDSKHQAYGTDIHISGHNPRIEALRETWFKDVEPFSSHVEAKFFYGLPHWREPAPDEVFLDVKDDYPSLPFKTLAICRWALENNFDYMLKVDDDTLVYIDRAVKELMENRFDYAGWEHSGVCTGGPGYWVSKRAMKVITEYSPTHWAEDVTVGHALSKANISPVMLPNHRPGFSAHWYWTNGFDPSKLTKEMVTAHAVQPEVMKDWYEHKNK